MLAYHGEIKNKRAILTQLRAHAKADEIIKGQYWENGKGCAVGCTVHSGNHAEYESRFGIPQMLARLEDCIFEGLQNGKAKAWPVQFMLAIKPGADLSRVGWQFMHWLLTDESINPGITHPLVCSAVKQCADVMIPLTKGEPVAAESTWSAAESAWNAALSAAESARSAAESTWSAARSAALSAAESAALSAAESVRSAAESTWSAAESARSAARSAWSAALSAAESAETYEKMAAKLLELMKAA